MAQDKVPGDVESFSPQNLDGEFAHRFPKPVFVLLGSERSSRFIAPSNKTIEGHGRYGDYFHGSVA
jgi:hypothetical protein